MHRRGVKDEAFAFDRTVSRLIEMQSDEYLQAQHTTLPAAAATPTAAAAAEAAAADDGGAIQKEETEEEPFLMRFESQKLTGDDIRAIWEKFDADGSVRRARRCVFFGGVFSHWDRDRKHVLENKKSVLVATSLRSH